VAALAVAALTWFRYVTNNINARIFVLGLALGCIGIACGITLVKEMPQDRKVGLVVTGLVYFLGGGVHLVRAVYIYAYAPVRDLFDPSASNALLFLGAPLAIVAWSSGFIVLSAKRFDVTSKFNANPRARAETEVRRQLNKIVESEVFRRSAQLERFLTLVVERSLLGRPGELKEYALSRDVFNRGENYDPRTDSMVRVEAQRLRRKLRKYYDTRGSEDPVIVS
jgi:hypothetical protein